MHRMYGLLMMASFILVGCADRILDSDSDGYWATYYESGQKKREGYYKDGNWDGRWVWYYENGVIMGEGNFRAGDGKWTGYHENGKKEYEVSYKNNKEDGNRVYFDEEGYVRQDVRQSSLDGNYADLLLGTWLDVDGNEVWVFTDDGLLEDRLTEQIILWELSDTTLTLQYDSDYTLAIAILSISKTELVYDDGFQQELLTKQLTDSELIVGSWNDPLGIMHIFGSDGLVTFAGFEISNGVATRTETIIGSWSIEGNRLIGGATDSELGNPAGQIFSVSSEILIFYGDPEGQSGKSIFRRGNPTATWISADESHSSNFTNTPDDPSLIEGTWINPSGQDVTFWSDGIYKEPDNDYEFKWEIQEGNKIYLESFFFHLFTYTVDQEELSLTLYSIFDMTPEGGGGTMVYKRKY